MLHLSGGITVRVFSPHAEFRAQICDFLYSGVTAEQVVERIVKNCSDADIRRVGPRDLTFLAGVILKLALWSEFDDGLRDDVSLVFQSRISELHKLSLLFNPHHTQAVDEHQSQIARKDLLIVKLVERLESSPLAADSENSSSPPPVRTMSDVTLEPPAAQLPIWNNSTCELRWHEKVVRKYRPIARNSIKILVFHRTLNFGYKLNLNEIFSRSGSRMARCPIVRFIGSS